MKNFKIFLHHEIEFVKRLNIIIGGHATGKTIIIDAIRFVVDPLFETSSENFNLNSLKYKPDNSDYIKTGYAELIFSCRNTDSKLFTVRRCFTNLEIVIIDQRQEMRMRDFYHVLRSRNYLTNSFIPSFIESEVLYRLDNNNGLFKPLFYYITENIKYFTLIRDLIVSCQNTLKSKIEKLKDYSDDYMSVVSDQEINNYICSRLKTISIFNEYIYNMRKERNVNYRLQRELDNLNFLEELHYEMLNVHEIDIDNIVKLSTNISLKTDASNFVDVNEMAHCIVNLVDQLHEKIIETHAIDIDSIVSYPMHLNAHQQINRYVMNLRRTLKTNNNIAKSIKNDIILLKTIIKRKQSAQANLIQIIDSKLSDFDNIKHTMNTLSLRMAEAGDNTTFAPFKHVIGFFLNNCLFYYKLKLILCFDYEQSILNGIQIANKICCNNRIIPVFNCIRFKDDFIIEEYFYDFLKPILEWIIVIESDSTPFVIPQLPIMCHMTWIPTQHLYTSSNRNLDAETQNIWDGLNFAALHEAEVLMKHEISILKFIFYQRQLQRIYDSSILSAGSESHPNDIIELCDTLATFYRISNLRDENEIHTNIFANQTEIPKQLSSFKEHLDTIILMTNTLPNDFKRLLTITEELQYNEADLKLKINCLKQFEESSEFDLIIEDFDLPRYKNSMDSIDQFKIDIEKLETKSLTLNYKFNKLFLDIYLPLDGMSVIVPDAKLRLKEFNDWLLFVSDIQLELGNCEQLAENNLLAIRELSATLKQKKKIFLTEDKEISCLIKSNEPKPLFLKYPMYDTLEEITYFVPFYEMMFGELKQAIRAIRQIKNIEFTSEAYASVKIQVLEQINNSIEIANQLLKNFNYKMKIGFTDWVDDGNFNDDFTMDLLKSFQFIIQKTINYYQHPSAMASLIEEMPTQGNIYLAKLMFILGVSIYNKHKLLTLDDISVVMNKNQNLLVNIAQFEDIYQDQQLIMTYNPDEIKAKDMMNDLSKISNIDGVNLINI